MNEELGLPAGKPPQPHPCFGQASLALVFPLRPANQDEVELAAGKSWTALIDRSCRSINPAIK